MGALAAGLPQVVTPLFTFDQRINARHVAAVGAGMGFEPGPTAIADAAAALLPLLAEPWYTVRAKAVAASIAQLPPPAAAVDAALNFIA
jgi:UDP:flavonoid glycosyltransferase YjiC (YdhE family)